MDPSIQQWVSSRYPFLDTIYYKIPSHISHKLIVATKSKSIKFEITLFFCSVCAQQSSVETPVSQQVSLCLHNFMHVSVSYCEQCSIEGCMKELYRLEGKGQVWLFIG